MASSPSFTVSTAYPIRSSSSRAKRLSISSSSITSTRLTGDGEWVLEGGFDIGLNGLGFSRKIDVHRGPPHHGMN